MTIYTIRNITNKQYTHCVLDVVLYHCACCFSSLWAVREQGGFAGVNRRREQRLNKYGLLGCKNKRQSQKFQYFLRVLFFIFPSSISVAVLK